MKVNTALDIITVGEENIRTFTGGRDKFEEEFKEGIETINSWQQSEELGEVNFDYYEETGKTVTLSIGFINYWVVVNDLNEGFLYDQFESEEEFLKTDIDFEEISIMYEDEGHTWHDGFILMVDSDNKGVLTHLKTAVKDFFEENE